MIFNSPIYSVHITQRSVWIGRFQTNKEASLHSVYWYVTRIFWMHCNSSTRIFIKFKKLHCLKKKKTFVFKIKKLSIYLFIKIITILSFLSPYCNRKIPDKPQDLKFVWVILSITFAIDFVKNLFQIYSFKLLFSF